MAATAPRRAQPAAASRRCSTRDRPRREAASGRPLLGFTGIATSTADEVVVPPGYTAKVLIAWGEPVSNGPAFKPDASNTAAEQAQQWGMHNDGIVYFPFPFFGSHRGLIVQNHEYTDDVLLFPDGKANWNAEKTAKSQAAHGVGVIEVFKLFGSWRVRRPSFLARRITASTPIDIAGPAAGHDLLKTSADPTGKRVLGTLNNCAMGFTPWGTYLACEENFNGYFRNTAPNDARDPLRRDHGQPERRCGTRPTPASTPTSSRTSRTASAGSTEINPWLPRSTPVKRTALGRVKHEGAWVEETEDGRVVVYMGDDQAGEYIYRYLSNEPWKRAFRRGTHPLDDGVLYVARFNADGTGDWLPLTPDNPALAGRSQAEILINTRAAADAVGATKMDRPEWIDVIDSKKEVYVTLTNNTGRTAATVDAANPRPNNVYGHIIRWGYADDFSDPVFFWEIFALAGDPAVPAHGSTIMGDKFGSPDGIYVDPDERLWIQTDVSSSTIDSGAYAGFGNNQMLARRSHDEGDPPLPRRPQQVRDHRLLLDARRARAVRRHPAPGRGTVGRQRPGQPQAVQLLARRPVRRPTEIGAHRDHEERWRCSRHLIPSGQPLASPRVPSTSAPMSTSSELNHSQSSTTTIDASAPYVLL